MLLLVNVAYFAWSYMHPLATAGNAVRHEEKGGLQLLSEVEVKPNEAAKQAQKQHVEAPKAAISVPVLKAENRVAVISQDKVSRSCYRVEGIESKKALDALATGLKQVGVDVTATGSKRVPLNNYWVTLPPYSSQQQADRTVEQLKGLGLKDLYRVRSGDSENAVSLGVFSSRDAAQRRIEEVKGLRLTAPEPRIQVIALATKRYWLSFSTRVETEDSGWERAVKTQQLQAKKVVCE